MNRGGHENNKEKRKDVGKAAEREVTKALEILKSNPDSVVLDFIYAANTQKDFDARGVDFLIFLKSAKITMPCSHVTTIGKFLAFPLQVKRSSGNKSILHCHNANIMEHYRKYPHILAIAVNGKSPERIARHIENLIKRVLRGAFPSCKK